MADGIMTCLLKNQRSQSSPGAINVRYIRAEGRGERKTTSLSRTSHAGREGTFVF